MYGHRSFQFQLPGHIRASFTWAPYAANVTAHMQGWCALPPPPPAVPQRGGGGVRLLASGQEGRSLSGCTPIPRLLLLAGALALVHLKACIINAKHCHLCTIARQFKCE